MTIAPLLAYTYVRYATQQLATLKVGLHACEEALLSLADEGALA